MFNRPFNNSSTSNNFVSTSKSKKNPNDLILNTYKTPKTRRNTPEPDIYIQLTGKRTKARVLNQIIFWSNKSKCDDGWFYKSYEDWTLELDIPERTLRRIFKEFEQEEWLETKIKKVRGKTYKHFRPSLSKIMQSIEDKLCIKPVHADKKQNEQKEVQTGQNGRSGSAKWPILYNESYYDIHRDNMGDIDISVREDDLNNKPPKFDDLDDWDNLDDWDCYAAWKSGNSNATAVKSTKSDYCGKRADNNQLKQKNTNKIQKQTLEQRAEEAKQMCLNDEKCRQAFDERFSEYEVEYEDLLQECFEYWLYQRQQVIYPSRWLKWIETQDPKKQGYRKRRLSSEEAMPTISSEEQELMSTRRTELLYARHGFKLLSEQDREKADELLRKYAVCDSTTSRTQKTKRISAIMQAKTFLQNCNLIGQYT